MFCGCLGDIWWGWLGLRIPAVLIFDNFFLCWHRYFCLRPSAKDQGITFVFVVVLVHHLVHFLFKRNLSEKKSSLTGNQTNVLQIHSQAHIHWATKPCILLMWNLISISSHRPWTSIGRHLFQWSWLRCLFGLRSWRTHLNLNLFVSWSCHISSRI